MFLYTIILLFVALNPFPFSKVSSNSDSLSGMASDTTYYYISRHIDLRGKRVNMPEKSVLVFSKNGKLYNGILVGNNTVVRASSNACLFSSSINLEGSFYATEANSNWFDCRSDCVLSNEKYVSGSNNLVQFNNMFHFNNITIAPGVYYVAFSKDYPSFYLPSNIKINGQGAIIKYVFYNRYISAFTIGNSDSDYPTTNISLNNLVLIGNKNESNISTEWVHGIACTYCDNVTINNVRSSFNRGDGFVIAGRRSINYDHLASNIRLIDCVADNNYRQGCSVENASNIYIYNSSFINTSGTLPEYGIDIEPNYYEIEDKKIVEHANNIIIDRCFFSGNNGGGVQLLSPNGVNIEDVIVRNSIFEESGIHFSGCRNIDITSCLFNNIKSNAIVFADAQNDSISVKGCIIEANQNLQEKTKGHGIFFTTTTVNSHSVKLDSIKISNFYWGLQTTDYVGKGSIKGLTIENVDVSNCFHNIYIGSTVNNASYSKITSSNLGEKSNGEKWTNWTFGWDKHFNDDVNSRIRNE